MNPIQIAIITFVVIVILLTLGYYWYDDARFKKKVENNFNQATKDILTDDNKAMILNGVDSQRVQEHRQFMPKDVVEGTPTTTDPLMGNHDIYQTDDVPEDSVEAFFVRLDKIDFIYSGQLNKNLDLIVDIVFEENKKLKILPEIAQFTHKHFVFYLLDKDNQWQVFEKGKKYVAKAIKLVVQIVDKEGVISQAQIANIYQELHKFVLNNDAHIRCSDYEDSITKIQEQIKHIHNIELVLELYLLIRNKQPYNLLAEFFTAHGLVATDGLFSLVENNQILFTIGNESQNVLDTNGEFSTLSIVAQLHLHEKPLHIVDKIFDLCEHFMTKFESRILTSNKQVVGQREYDQLYAFVKNYIDSADKKHIQLGGDLIKRIF
jgi:hypothetical protein